MIDEAICSELTVDTVCDVLSNEYRRTVLYHLEASSNGESTIDSLAERVVAVDTEYENRDRAVTRLYHTTLPMLEDVGLVEYDVRSDSVRYRSDPLFELFLSLSAEIEDPTVSGQ